MYPNEKFLKFFPKELLPFEKDTQFRSGCLHFGAYTVIRKIVAEYQLDEMLGRIVGQDAGLFLDLAAYSIITEDNAGQYYPDYAYNHALFTDNMKIYSDSKVSDFIGKVTDNQINSNNIMAITLTLQTFLNTIFVISYSFFHCLHLRDCIRCVCTHCTG